MFIFIAEQNQFKISHLLIEILRITTQQIGSLGNFLIYYQKQHVEPWVNSTRIYLYKTIIRNCSTLWWIINSTYVFFIKTYYWDLMVQLHTFLMSLKFQSISTIHIIISPKILLQRRRWLKSQHLTQVFELFVLEDSKEWDCLLTSLNPELRVQKL